MRLAYSIPFIPCLVTETVWHWTLLDLMCFFQEKFQESLKRLRQEQQEAEKLKAVITARRTSWEVRETVPEGVLGTRAGNGSQGQRTLVLSVPGLARRASLCLVLHCNPSKKGYCSWCWAGKRKGIFRKWTYQKGIQHFLFVLFCFLMTII